MRLAFLSALALVMVSPLAAAPAQRPATAQKDWTRIVAMTPDGGFRMGNPNARAKLVEYGSYTCPHCADFAKTSVPALISTYVKSGKASYEYRNFVLNGVDASVTVLARCAGPRGFFPFTESIFATQREWIGKIGDMTQQERDRIKALPKEQQVGQLAEAAGLLALAARAGVSRPKALQCLADDAGYVRIDGMNKAGAALGVKGTPTIFLNGAIVEAHGWPELEPLIQRAAG